MALPVLDGNQSATTLSSVVTGGEHIVAHTVVSLGSTAISNITSAVSGSVVTIPSLERIANSAATDGIADTTLNFIKIGGHQSGSNQTAHIVHVSTGGAMSVDATDSVVSISNFPSTQTIAGTVTANVIGTRTFVDGNAVTVSGFLSVGGWDTANYQHAPIPLTDGGLGVRVGFDDQNGAPLQVVNYPSAPLYATVTVGNSVTIGSLPAISGTVTVSNATTASAVAVRLIAEDTNPGGSGAGVNVNLYSNDNALLVDALKNGNSVLGYDGLSSYVQVKPAVGSSVTIGSVPNGSLTTRFGTPTTANTAFATSAVTNANRKYLLIQNVTTGSNVITVGIGFTPTTTQGIQLTAGAGITFESSYIPTGAVYVLSSVTASNFTILEA